MKNSIYSSLTIMIILTAMQYGKHILVVATPWEILTRENSSPYCQTQLVTAVYADIYSALCTTLAWISSVIMFSKGRMKSQWFTKVDKEVLLNGKWKLEWALHSGRRSAIKSIAKQPARPLCCAPPWRRKSYDLVRVARWSWASKHGQRYEGAKRPTTRCLPSPPILEWKSNEQTNN